MEGSFQTIDHTADIGIIASGSDMSQAFANAARALFSLITELDNIEEALHRDIEITAADEESLLVAWLNELIYLFAFITSIFAMLAGFVAYVYGWIEDITEAISFTGKVVSIAVKSFAFGLGVSR